MVSWQLGLLAPYSFLACRWSCPVVPDMWAISWDRQEVVHVKDTAASRRRAIAVICLCACAVGSVQAAQARPPAAGPVAKISLPWQDSLVRADVPVFGVADAPNLKQWRLEFGEGTKPNRWEVINASARPQRVDPWTGGKVKWNPNSGAKGNLGVWHTGLSTYRYPGRTENLNGVFTLRLTSLTTLNANGTGAPS